jgi:protein phosphatase
MSDPLRQFDSAAATDVGKVRSHNEDAFLVNPEAGVWAVADGMGGHEAGSLASTTVVEALRQVVGPAPVDQLVIQCRRQLAQANRRLLDIAAERRGMIIGTTVAALLIDDETYACVWSGDSRIYLIRGEEITQLSNDHTEVAELIAEGVLSEEEALTWPRRNVVTRAIGVHEEAELEICQDRFEKGDIFLICSDGLTAHVKDAEILAHVRGNGAQSACDALVALTIERGATDNVTVVMVRYGHGGGTLLFPQPHPKPPPRPSDGGVDV